MNAEKCNMTILENWLILLK